MKVVAYLRKTNSSVYIRVRDGRSSDFRVPSGLFIEPSLFDPNAPGYKDTPEVPKKEREQFNKRLKKLISVGKHNIFVKCCYKRICKTYTSGNVPKKIQGFLNCCKRNLLKLNTDYLALIRKKHERFLNTQFTYFHARFLLIGWFQAGFCD